MSGDNESKRGLANVVALGLVSMLNDISSEMALSVFPIFIVKHLNASIAILGIIEGIAQLLSYMLRIFSGIISDMIGRRKLLMILGYGISVTVKPLLAFATRWIHALTIRILDRVGKGIRASPRDALIADSVGSSHAGKAFGIHRTMDQIGAILGPSVAFLLLPLGGYRGVFLLSAIPGFLSIFILILSVKEFMSVKSGKRKHPLVNLHVILRDKAITSYLAINFLFSLSIFNYAFILVYAHESGLEELMIPLIYLLLNLMHIIISLLIGILADKFSPLMYSPYLMACSP